MTSQPAPPTASAVPPEPAPGPVRRRRWVLPALLVVGWLLVAGGVGGQYTGRLAEVQKNDASSFLPADAESTRVSDLQQQSTGARAYPAVVVVESDSALTDRQLAAVRAFARDLPDLTIAIPGRAPVRVGDLLVPGAVPVVPSRDGKAALALVNLDTARVAHPLPDGTSATQRVVEVIRAADRGLAGTGVRVYVAGPAGAIADLIVAFGGIDGILLVVALAAVAVILFTVYRSPVVPLLVLLSAGLALALSSLLVYLLADHGVVTLDGQGQGILSILVVGAGTDYSLLLVARYREELHRHDDRYTAMRLAWRRTLEPVAASAGTVVLGLLCLLLSRLGPTRSLGPVGAIGIVSALLVSLTFLPALLVLPGRTGPGEHGRWVFWPRTPHVRPGVAETAGIWARLSRTVGAHPRRVWALSALALIILAAFLPTLRARGVTQADTFLTPVESVRGGEALARHFPGGSGDPTVVIGPAADRDAMLAVVRQTPGVAAVAGTPVAVGGQAELQVTLTDPADSPAADRTVRELRAALDTVGPDALVGGGTATNLDVRDVSARDRGVIIPVVLLVIFVVLALLLRSLVAALLLLVANVLSFAATLGASAIVFNHVLGFPGANPGVPLYGFVFLVALGIDYSIFLMTRVREESTRRGTPSGILAGLAVTGGVITSAGVVLAATFAALGVLPILFLAQIAFIVAFGVLLDTLVVRSLLVPALSKELGRWVWWPGRLPADA